MPVLLYTPEFPSKERAPALKRCGRYAQNSLRTIRHPMQPQAGQGNCCFSDPLCRNRRLCCRPHRPLLSVQCFVLPMLQVNSTKLKLGRGRLKTIFFISARCLGWLKFVFANIWRRISAEDRDPCNHTISHRGCSLYRACSQRFFLSHREFVGGLLFGHFRNPSK